MDVKKKVLMKERRKKYKVTVRPIQPSQSEISSEEAAKEIVMKIQSVRGVTYDAEKVIASALASAEKKGYDSKMELLIGRIKELQEAMKSDCKKCELKGWNQAIEAIGSLFFGLKGKVSVEFIASQLEKLKR